MQINLILSFTVYLLILQVKSFEEVSSTKQWMECLKKQNNKYWGKIPWYFGGFCCQKTEFANECSSRDKKACSDDVDFDNNIPMQYLLWPYAYDPDIINWGTSIFSLSSHWSDSVVNAVIKSETHWKYLIDIISDDLNLIKTYRFSNIEVKQAKIYFFIYNEDDKTYEFYRNLEEGETDTSIKLIGRRDLIVLAKLIDESKEGTLSFKVGTTGYEDTENYELAIVLPTIFLVLLITLCIILFFFSWLKLKLKREDYQEINSV